MRDISLKTKFLIVSIGVVVLLGIAVVIFIQTAFSKKLTDEIQKRGLTIAGYLSEDVVNPILTEDMIALNLLLLDHKKSEKNVEYIYVLNSRNEVIAHTFKDVFPAGLIRMNLLKSFQPQSIKSLTVEGRTIVDIAVPILKGELGILHMGVSGETVKKDVGDLVKGITLITISVVILGAAVAFIFITAITKPLSELIRAERMVGSGDLSYKADIKTGDEIGQLANAFNKMVEDLQRTTVSRSQLEKLVEDRTIELQKEIRDRRQAEEFVKNILETVDEGFIIIDREYRIVSANKAYCEQVRMPCKEIVGRHCYEVSHHLFKPCYEAGEDCSVRHVFDTGEPYAVVHVHRDKEGNPIFVETKAYPLKDAEGEVVSAIEIVNDITEKKRLEEQLRQSQKMEAVGTLAGGIAHDFNNILTAVMGYGSLLRGKMAKDDPNRPYVEQILASSERATNLIQGLLAFGRKQVINPRPVNLNDIVKNVEKLLLRLIGEDIELKSILAGKDLIIMADSGQIEQVLMNLSTNARDAMPEGGCLTLETKSVSIGREYLKTHLLAEPGIYAVLSVSDTGIGMDEKTKEKIFEPFFTTKEKGKGTGLGLAMVYGIVSQHNGYINVYSEPDKGTTFKIYLPLIKKEAEAAEAIEMPPPPEGTETVLVAEDDADVRILIKDVLEGHGYGVIEAIDGEDAVKIFGENKDRIHMVLLDVIMPKKSGRDAYNAIKEMKPDVKTMFMSGYTADIIHRKGILEEGLYFIPKPILPDELLRKVRWVLDEK